MSQMVYCLKEADSIIHDIKREQLRVCDSFYDDTDGKGYRKAKPNDGGVRDIVDNASGYVDGFGVQKKPNKKIHFCKKFYFSHEYLTYILSRLIKKILNLLRNTLL